MPARRASRLHALLLAAVVLGGWVVLPAADILLYHRRAATPDVGAQLTRAGDPLPHALRCVLSDTCPRPRLPATPTDLPSSVQVREDSAPHRSPDRPRSRTRSGIPHPRAPPVSGR